MRIKHIWLAVGPVAVAVVEEDVVVVAVAAAEDVVARQLNWSNNRSQ